MGKSYFSSTPMSEETTTNEQEASSEEGKAGLVFLTLFILALVAALVAMPFSEKVADLAKLLSSDDKYLAVFGNMHPLVLHLPIGIVFLTLVMECLGWISFGRYRPVTSVGLFLAVFTGALACVTGYVDMHTDGYASNDIWDFNKPWNRHMWLGILFVAVLALAFLSRVWGGSKGSRNPIYAILLFISAGVMGFGAHIGGEEVHGPTGVEKIVKELTGQTEGDVADADSDAPKVIKAPADRLAYADVVVPILQSKCLACHAVDTKKKGGLLMDSWEALLAGGDSMPEFPTLVPGDVKMSYMIEVIHLPLDDEDDMHMPPPKKDQLEDYELAILDWWVGALSKSDVLDDKTLTEMGAPPEIIEAASKLVSPEELAAAAAAEEAAQKAVVDAKEAKREALDSALGELRQDPQLKTAINYISQDSSDLEFTAISLRKAMTDEQFAKLAPVSEAITSLQLGSTSISEAAVEEQLPKMTNLKKLNLSQTAITDKGLDAVAQLKDLEWLNLYGTEVTDAGIMKLKSLTKLEKIYLWNSKATPAGGEALQKELPQVEIIFGIN